MHKSDSEAFYTIVDKVMYVRSWYKVADKGSASNSRIYVHVAVKISLGFASCNYVLDCYTGTIILELCTQNACHIQNAEERSESLSEGLYPSYRSLVVINTLYLQEVSAVKYTLNAENIPDPSLWLSPRLGFKSPLVWDFLHSIVKVWVKLRNSL